MIQKPFQGRAPGAHLQAPDELQIRISYSGIGQYMIVTERDNKPVAVADMLACANALSHSALEAMVKEQSMTLCKKCGRNIAAANQGGNDGKAEI